LYAAAGHRIITFAPGLSRSGGANRRAPLHH
jgi:hypothetical protein